jgi:hypothetical protein
MTKALVPSLMFFGVLSLSTPAYAYLDPGTGSMILQLLLGGAAGVAMVFKLYWHKIKTVLGYAPKSDDYTETEETGNQ